LEESSEGLTKLISRMLDDAMKLTVDRIFKKKTKDESIYDLEGYQNTENLWHPIF
jgi:hypothetical protein